ncbi:uracil-DNA glycosylase family protein [Halocola ammonii]
MSKDSTFAQKVIAFNESLSLDTRLPKDVGVMNPFRENEFATPISEEFYKKYYSDNNKRTYIIGINPGRFGAGVTGVPFTDTKRMESECGIEVEAMSTHEPSSVFVYEFINAYGGPEAFYRDFYINSVSPLGFLKHKENGKSVNYNYYDSKELEKAVEPFVKEKMEEQIDFGLHRKVALALGSGKNYKYLKKLNEEEQYFEEIIPLEHPRYVMQYKSKNKDEYIAKFVEKLRLADRLNNEG